MRPEQAARPKMERSGKSAPRSARSEIEGLRARHARALPLDVRAPAIARIVVAEFLHGRVPASVIERARLVASELVTNSVRHSGVSDGVVVVGIELTATMVRLEVADPGRAGVISPRPPDRTGSGGLDCTWCSRSANGGGSNASRRVAPASGRSCYASLRKERHDRGARHSRRADDLACL